nr:GntR family transcriptional regulator [Streptomyces sp. B3I8]
MPPGRQLAADLGLAPGTVARAYRELEAASLITSRRGAGTRVAATLPAPAPSPVAPPELAELAGRFIAEAQRLGADGKTMLDAVREALDQRPQDGATVVRGARPSSRNFEGKT